MARSAAQGHPRRPFQKPHRYLKLDEDNLRQCFAEGDICKALGPGLADAFLEWSRVELPGQDEHPDFEQLVRDGWMIEREDAASRTAEALQSTGLADKGVPARPPDDRRITLAHLYCLFFREHLKRNPKVFRILVADTLNAMSVRLDKLGDNLTDALKTLREQVKTLAAAPPDFSCFEQWLEPQLGGIKMLLGDVKIQLDVVARSQRELADKQGEILVAITTLRTEVARNTAAAPIAAGSLTELSAFIAQLERKFDYLLAGFPIMPFKLPDPPTHELELLHAKHRAVDFVGRQSDLDALSAWLETPEPISARLLVGGAGTGKTRLAFELLLRVNAELPGWQAGLVTGSALRKFDATKQPADWSWPLLVVDYAQTLASPLAELLVALTHKHRDNGLPPLRVLLLERQPGDWFDDLLREEDSGGPCAVRGLFHPPTPMPLTPLSEGALRRQVLEQTLARAAIFSGRPPPVLPGDGDAAFVASLKRALFSLPLNLMLAALAAGELGLLPALNRSRVELAVELARRELRRIGRFARTPGNAAQEKILQHLAACATMERGFTAEERDRAVTEELPALKINWPDGAGDLAAVLRRALPSNGLAVAPVEPDFVGEALVLAALAKPDGAGTGRWQKWSSTVERCCRRDSRATPATLLHAFQNFGHRPEYGEPLLAATDALIRAGLADAEPGLLLGIENALPHRTVELLPRAAEVTHHLYERLKAAMQKGRELKPEVARLANNLGVRLSQAGLHKEALTPAQEATDLYRGLARQNPDTFGPDLAMSLNNLAIRLSELGRRAQALAPAQEAVELYRALARQNPDAFGPGLAMSLNTLATFLSDLGRRAEALAPAQEAVELYRGLARQNPDAFQPDLAMSLNTLAIRLSELGRRAQALAPAQEAVEIRRALARQNPDAFQPDLAMSLNNLATFLGELGRRAEALDSAQEAVELYRALVRRNPEAFQPALAGSLNILAIRLSELGRGAEALAPVQEATDLHRGLARRNPDAFQPALAMSLNNLAIRLGELGRRAEALAPGQEAAELYRGLARQNPDAFGEVLAKSL